MTVRARPGNDRNPVQAALQAGAVVLATGLVLAACGTTPTAAPRSARVTRASVSTTVSAVGSLSATGQANVGFPKGGQLTTVRVRVGDQVTAGQVLATVDDFAARQALTQARAQASAQQANLDRVEDATGVDGARASLDQAERVLAATRGQVDATADADDSAVASAPPGAGAAAEQKRSTDRAGGRVQVESARVAVVNAQNALDAARADRPHTIDAAQAASDGADAAVDSAQRDLNNSVLKAPTAGTVTALNGAVGEFLAPSAGTTAEAPGGDASIPGAAAAASGTGAPGGAGAAGAGASPTRPGGAQFIVLNNATTFKVVAPFEESDAAAIAPNQQVDLSVDGVPNATLTGTVTSVAPSGTAIANVINYYVTIGLTQTDPRLRDGQTVRASVVTGQIANALSVPNSAVRRQGEATSVVVLGADGRHVTTPFTAGLVGPDRTQVVSGLSENQEILLTGGR